MVEPPGSGPSQRNDHVRDPRGHDPLAGLQVLRNALGTQASLLNGPVGERHGHVVVRDAVQADRGHRHDDRFLFAHHQGQPTSSNQSSARSSVSERTSTRVDQPPTSTSISAGDTSPLAAATLRDRLQPSRTRTGSGRNGGTRRTPVTSADSEVSISLAATSSELGEADQMTSAPAMSWLRSPAGSWIHTWMPSPWGNASTRGPPSSVHRNRTRRASRSTT